MDLIFIIANLFLFGCNFNLLENIAAIENTKKTTVIIVYLFIFFIIRIIKLRFFWYGRPNIS